MKTFWITLGQMGKLFAFMVCGYIMQKRKAPEATGAVLSQLEVNIFLPALCFNTFAGNFHVDTMLAKWPYLAVGTVVLALSYLLAVSLAKAFASDKMVQSIYIYSITVPNLGYLGYPLVGAVFGQEMLLCFMIFAIPYNLFIYTVGMYILKPVRDRFTLKKLLNPAIGGMVLGMLVGMLNLRLPAVVSDTMNMAADCMAPVAMILTGFILGRSSFKTMLGSPRIYAGALLRLAVLPLTFLGIGLLVGLDRGVVLIMTSLLCMPFGLNSVVFPEAYGGDSTAGAQLGFVSNVLGILSIPLMFGLLSKLFL